MTHLLTKIEYNVRDLIFLAFDNIGFKGKDGKGAQHTAIQFTVITEKELRALGFYNNYEDIARHRKTMSELILEHNNKKAKQLIISLLPTRMTIKYFRKE